MNIWGKNDNWEENERWGRKCVDGDLMNGWGEKKQFERK